MKNITFKTLSITNFLSFGKETVFQLDKGGISVITGYNYDKEDGNGVGKSGVLDAFFFAIFGETLKTLKKDQIVNDIAKKNCKVVLDFDIDQNGTVTSYSIQRGISPSYCKLIVNGEEDETLSTMPVTNHHILNLINSTSSVFKNTITMRANNTIPFMAQKKNEKREFVEGILRLELFKIMNKIAKENYGEIVKDYAVTNKTHEDITRNIELYTERKENFEQNRVEKMSTLEERIKTISSEIKTLSKRMVKIDDSGLPKIILELSELNKELEKTEKAFNNTTSSVSALETTLKINNNKLSNISIKSKELKEQYDTYPKYDSAIKTSEDCANYIETTRLEIEALKPLLVEFNRDIRDQQQKIKKINETGSFCDKCNRPFPENDVKANKDAIKECNDLIAQHQKSITETQDAIEDKCHRADKAEVILKIMALSTEKKSIISENESINGTLETRKVELSNTQGLIKGLKATQEVVQSQKDELQNQINNNKGLKTLIENNTNNLKYCEEDIVKLSLEKNEFSDLITTTEVKRAEIEKGLEAFKEKVAIYDVIKYVVSDEGIKSFIIKKLLGVLNERIAYYLIETDANCTLVFDEYFDDKIINDKGNEASYENFSNGEQKRIDLACLFSFMDLRRIQGDVSSNLAFYDELLDSALSVNGSAKVFNILKDRFDKYQESSFVVTHKKENLKSPLINDIIFLEKSGGITRLGEYKA